MTETRRFKPPWSIEEGAACFIVRDHDKQALAYVYYENESGRRSSAKLLTRDEAFLIAVNIAKLPSAPRQILKDIPRPQIPPAGTIEREGNVRIHLTDQHARIGQIGAVAVLP